jgi:uncharacterized protein involved in outer membrane biogenesis
MPGRPWLKALGAGLALLGGAVLLIILVPPTAWLRPIAEARATALLGRAVHITDLALRLGAMTEVELRGVRVANPEGFAAEGDFAEIAQVTLRFDIWASWRSGAPVIALMAINGASIQPRVLADGSHNLAFAFGPPPGEDAVGTPPPFPIGLVTISGGEARLLHTPLRADVAWHFETRDSAEPQQLIVSAEGHYAGAPITARLVSGAILGVRDATNPWPVEAELVNGTTRGTLRGTLRNPLLLAGADLRLELSGPDMRFLTPLTGVPIPSTPEFSIAGRLALAAGRLRFTEIAGRVGNSDLEGEVTMQPRQGHPDITADLRSRRVDLADLAGFIGGNPGRGRPMRSDAGSTGRVLPNAPVNFPLFRAADIHARFRASQIRGADSPLDNLDATVDLVNGVLTLHPLRGAVGRGEAVVNATLTPRGDMLHAVGEVELRRLDIGRLMRALGGRGGGSLDGRASIESLGASTAQLLARGNGALTLRTAGGNLSAFAVDIAGLRLVNAMFSAFGLPSRTELQCFVADFALQAGVLNTRAMLLETSEALLIGSGRIRLDQETLDLRLRSQAKHFTVGSLRTSMAVTGSFSDPSVFPVIVQNSGDGALDRLWDLATAPLSLLPIVELGIGDDPRCAAMLRRAGAPRR